MEKEVIAANLRAARGEETQACIADRAGVSRSAYNQYERAKRIPTDDIKIKLAAALNTTVQCLFYP